MYGDIQEKMEEAAKTRSSHDYLGREFSLGGFFRVNIFGPGFPDGKVGVVGVGMSRRP